LVVGDRHSFAATSSREISVADTPPVAKTGHGHDPDSGDALTVAAVLVASRGGDLELGRRDELEPESEEQEAGQRDPAG
jgi:hypothetical protein